MTSWRTDGQAYDPQKHPGAKRFITAGAEAG
jgi:hypothetical protein